jgi:hypothetical protein
MQCFPLKEREHRMQQPAYFVPLYLNSMIFMQPLP